MVTKELEKRRNGRMERKDDETKKDTKEVRVIDKRRSEGGRREMGEGGGGGVKSSINFQKQLLAEKQSCGLTTYVSSFQVLHYSSTQTVN